MSDQWNALTRAQQRVTASDRYLLSTDHLVEVVIDIARVLTARRVADDDDRRAMQRLRNHPAVRKLAGTGPPQAARKPYRRHVRPAEVDEFGDPGPDEGNAA